MHEGDRFDRAQNEPIIGDGELKFIQNRSKNRFLDKRTTIHHR